MKTTGVKFSFRNMNFIFFIDFETVYRRDLVTCPSGTGTDHVLKRIAFTYTEFSGCRIKTAVYGRISGSIYTTEIDGGSGATITRISADGVLSWTKFESYNFDERNLSIDNNETKLAYSVCPLPNCMLTVLNPLDGALVQRYKW